MKAPIDKFKPFLQAEAAAAREKRAAIELKIEPVRLSMHDAAKKGLTVYRVPLPRDLDVRGTEAAARLMEWCKGEGFTLTWEKRSVTLDDGRQVDAWVPEISWSTATRI